MAFRSTILELTRTKEVVLKTLVIDDWLQALTFHDTLRRQVEEHSRVLYASLLDLEERDESCCGGNKGDVLV